MNTCSICGIEVFTRNTLSKELICINCLEKAYDSLEEAITMQNELIKELKFEKEKAIKESRRLLYENDALHITNKLLNETIDKIGG
jgi:peptidoglycan hydrolase CwlO-like protein